MVNVLVTNDDGVSAFGITAITKALKESGDYSIRVVAPDSEKSGTSHSVTLLRSLRVRYTPTGLTQGLPVDVPTWGVSGTPVDAVRLALEGTLFSATALNSKSNAHETLKEEWRPDLLVSGINLGANFAGLTYYSGTFGAAREGAFQGVKSLALSLDSGRSVPREDFDQAAVLVLPIVKWLANDSHWPSDVVLNVNIPWHGGGWARKLTSSTICSAACGIAISSMSCANIKPTFSLENADCQVNGEEYKGTQHEALDLGLFAHVDMRTNGTFGSIENDDIVAVANGFVALAPVAPGYCFEKMSQAFSILSEWRRTKKHPTLPWHEVSGDETTAQQSAASKF